MQQSVLYIIRKQRRPLYLGTLSELKASALDKMDFTSKHQWQGGV